MNRLLTFLLAALITTASAASPERETPVTDVHFALGTVCVITLYETVKGFEFEQAFDVIDEIDGRMSVYHGSSEVNAINASAGSAAVRVSDDTFHVISEGLRYGSVSEGRFDITIQPLVELWGIGTEWQKIPTDVEIDAARSLVDYRAVEIDEAARTVRLEHPGMALDLGAIAKGYAADAVRDYLIERGFSRGILNFGGNVLAFGSKPGGAPWKIGIQDPRQPRGEYLGIIEAGQGAVVSSGVYERYFEADGRRYHHILDTSTGFPVENDLSSVTVVSGDAIIADAYSTIAFAMGSRDGLDLIESVQGIEAVFVTREGMVYTTPGLSESFVLTGAGYYSSGAPIH